MRRYLYSDEAYNELGGLPFVSTEVRTKRMLKFWNGSAWVFRPLKRWNGTAWVPVVLKEVPPPVIYGDTFDTSFDGSGSLPSHWFTHHTWAIRFENSYARATHSWADLVYNAAEFRSSDMYVQTVQDMALGTWVDGIGPAARFTSNSDGTYTGYCLRLMRYNNDNLRWELERNGVDVLGPTETAINAASGVMITARIEAQGAQVRCYLNGSLVGTYTDPSPLTGNKPGIQMHDSTVYIHDWEAGELLNAIP